MPRYRWTARSAPGVIAEVETVLTDTRTGQVIHSARVPLQAGAVGINLPPDSDDPRTALGSFLLSAPAGSGVHYSEAGQIIQELPDGQHSYIDGHYYERLGTTSWIKVDEPPAPAPSNLLTIAAVVAAGWFLFNRR